MFINNFEPVAIQIFSIEIRWYSLAYIFGILFAWIYCKKILIKDKNISKLFDDLISYLIIGIILGGRLGYVMFYNIKYYLSNPIEILMIWQGGMSFHGGLLGVLIATIIFAKKNNVNKYIFLDLISASAPIAQTSYSPNPLLGRSAPPPPASRPQGTKGPESTLLFGRCYLCCIHPRMRPFIGGTSLLLAPHLRLLSFRFAPRRFDSSTGFLIVHPPSLSRFRRLGWLPAARHLKGFHYQRTQTLACKFFITALAS